MRYFKLTLSFSLHLAFSLNGVSLAEASDPLSLLNFQKQVANSIKKAQAVSQAEMVLDFLRQKFMLPKPPWSLNPYPSSDQVATTKPRIQVNSALSATSTSVVPRWEIRQRQEGGICINLPSPVTSTAANLAATDCPASAVEFVADNSTFASIERSPASGSEQRGFIVLINPSQLSEADRLSLFSNPNPTSNTSTALLSVPVKFLSYVTDPTNSQRIRLKVAVGNVTGEIPIPPSPPSCTLTVARNASANNTCTVTLTSSGVTTSASLRSHPSVTLTNSGNTWTNSSVNCPIDSSTNFTGAVTGPGSSQGVACDPGVTINSLCSPDLFKEKLFTIVGANQALTLENPTCYPYLSAVCIGGGGGGQNFDNGDDSNGGGGGALAWFANKTYSASDVYTLTVGAAGTRGVDGGDSIFMAGTSQIIRAGGGQDGSTKTGGVIPSSNPTITGVTFGGGNGGRGGVRYLDWYGGGGGGAGGYSGAGGNGGNAGASSRQAGSSGAGGGGGGGGAACEGPGRGGGTALYGKGTNGAGSSPSGTCKRGAGEKAPPGGDGSPKAGKVTYGGGGSGFGEAPTPAQQGACRVVFSKGQWNWLAQ